MITRYRVSGMTCQHCVAHVKAEVAQLPGVLGVELTLDGAMVIESADRLPDDQVVEAVREAGDYWVSALSEQ